MIAIDGSKPMFHKYELKEIGDVLLMKRKYSLQ